MPKEKTAAIEQKESVALEKVTASPLPVFSGQQMADALQAYKGLQKSLDASMPDQLMKISGKDFRKKGYWRAIRMSFNLQVECISDKRVQYNDDPTDWGYEVTYRATAPNGSTADGDGSCTRAEKSTGKMKATVHNVRSHAHTRAMNRAISNLVGFGEVSAEEVNRDEQPNWQERQQAAQAKADQQATVEGGYRANPEFAGKASDDRIIFPGTYVRKIKSGKAVVYKIFGEDILFPIKQVIGQTPTEVIVTKWIAEKKRDADELPWEAVKLIDDAGQDRGDAWEGDDAPPIADDDVPY